jgi:rhodanese-related sulfurtransferase
MPDLIRHPVTIWIPAFAGMTTLMYLFAGIIRCEAFRNIQQERRTIMMKKSLCAFVGIMVFVAAASAASAGGYNYITAQELEKRLKQGPPVILVDICPVDHFAEGHIPGSIETNAYPAKTAEEKARPDTVMPKIRSSSDDVVILCPKGGGGAKNTFDYCKSKGLSEKEVVDPGKRDGGMFFRNHFTDSPAHWVHFLSCGSPFFPIRSTR